MEIPLQITGRDFELSDAIRAEIEQKAKKLEKFYDRITRCRVVVESPHRHRQKGRQYHVQIHVTLPGGEIDVKRESHEDLYVAIRNSFNAARRKIEDFARRQRGDVKHHESVPRARIGSLFPAEGYGFIVTEEDREIYFHEHSLSNRKFRHLKVGMQVRFREEPGEKGPQATSVTIV